MIKEIILISLIAKSFVEFQALPVANHTPANVVYDDVNKTITFKANQCDFEESWRLIHDGKKVIDLFYSKGITTTIYMIFEADTAQECLDEIKRLNLIDEREFKEEERIMSGKEVKE